MEEMISQEAIALNKLERKIVCCSEFEQFSSERIPQNS